VDYGGETVFVMLANCRNMTLVDREDLPIALSQGWSLCENTHGHTAYAQGSYAIKLHRLILPGCHEVDHINGNGLDNRRCNLRPALGRNQSNVNRRRDNTSGYKGVHIDKRWGHFVARIQVNGVRKSLGCYADPKQAAHAYDEAAKKFFGEFARLNFPEEPQ
jgi:hypothetical protein